MVEGFHRRSRAVTCVKKKKNFGKIRGEAEHRFFIERKSKFVAGCAVYTVECGIRNRCIGKYQSDRDRVTR